jgi:hypothetical protein
VNKETIILHSLVLTIVYVDSLVWWCDYGTPNKWDFWHPLPNKEHSVYFVLLVFALHWKDSICLGWEFELCAHNGQELAIYNQNLGWKPQASFIEYMHIKDTLEEKIHDLIER